MVAVHPDDETLGCGGTLLKHKAQGDEIHWLILTAMTPENGFSQDAIDRRDQEIDAVTKMYGFNTVHRLGFPAARLDEVPMSTMVAAISQVFHSVLPNSVYLPFQNDAHSDHQHAFKAAYSCTKVFRHPSVTKVMMVETLSETDFAQAAGGGFVPNLFVDVTAHFEQKIEILKVYQSEMGIHPFPRSEKSIKALAVLRGAAAGCEYAESFMVLKDIV